MKTWILAPSTFAAVAAFGFAQVSLANICASSFNGQYPTEAAARKATTVLSQTGGIAGTSTAREKEIADTTQEMQDEILAQGKYVGKNDTPPIEFFPRDGVSTKYLTHADGLNHETTRIVLSGVGSSGLVEGTLLAPVSGHTSPTDARKWSTTDSYDLTTDVSLDKDGKQWNRASGGNAQVSSSEQFLVQKQKSQGVVTAQELSVQLVKDRVVRIIYYRLGVNSYMGAPGGYFDGRVLELVWDGT